MYLAEGIEEELRVNQTRTEYREKYRSERPDVILPHDMQKTDGFESLRLNRKCFFYSRDFWRLVRFLKGDEAA